MRFGIVLAALLATQPALADTAFDDISLTIPMTDAQGRQQHLAGRLCVPQGVAGRVRLVLLNHGSPADSGARPRMTLGGCSTDVAQWFLARGFAVAFVMRRGYGATGGNFAEDHGNCEFPDYIHAGSRISA